MRNYFTRPRAWIGALAVLLLAIGSAVGQEFRGTITGTVTDPNGAIVSGASVTVKNVGTNVSSTVTTNDSGAYTVPFLAPGTYNISATGSGFKTSVRENLTVQVDDRLTIDLQLEIGAAAEVNIVADTEMP